MDNLNTHKPGALYETFPQEEAKQLWECEFIYTPKHGSWLNMEEIELNVLMGHFFRRRIYEMTTMRDEVDAWQKNRITRRLQLIVNLIQLMPESN
jgi:hypothetical protein